jgi:hypothetical protein
LLRVNLEPIEDLIVLRQREEVVRKGRGSLLVESLESGILFDGKNHHRGCAAFGHELRLAASRRLK